MARRGRPRRQHSLTSLPLRLVHLSDLHLGYRQYQRVTPRGINQREADVSRSFHRAIEQTIAIAPQLVLIAGDVFHQVRPTNTAIVDAYQQFSLLRRSLPDARIVMIAGNHDTPRSSELICILRLFSSIGIDVVDGNAQAIDYPDLDLEIVAVPSAMFEHARFVPSGTRSRNILLTHGSVQNERSNFAAPSGAPLLELPEDNLHLDEWTYVALGHWHTYNPIRSNEVYAGSIDYTSSNPWGELYEEHRRGWKGKCIIEFDLDTGEKTPHWLEKSREFVDLLEIDARGSTAEEVNALIEQRVEGCEGGIDDKVVRLVVRNIQRHVARQLDHRRLRDYRQRALHFHLDPRRPELTRTASQGAPGRRPSLAELVRDKLRERVVPPGLDRETLVDLGALYLKEAEEREADVVPVLGAAE